MDACTNPDILRVIWFFMIILDIVKIIIPIALIVLGIVDFSKAVITSDEKAQQKSVKLFGKRILYAILVFIIPWLVEVFMITLGNLIGEEGKVNFTDCIENATGEKIKQLEQTKENEKNGLYCWQCNDNSDLYKWGTSSGTNVNCHAGWHKIDNVLEEDCGVKSCYMCTATNDRYWGVNTRFSDVSCPTSWVSTNETKENCK